MTVESTIDRSALSVTFTADFDAPIDRVWQVWEDARQLERWWGPPTYPATFPQHELRVGGEARYYMTSPEGDKYHGWMRFDEVDEPRRIRFTDGFGDDNGEPDDSLPVTRSVVTLTEVDGRTRMQIDSNYASLEDLDKVIAMGFEEGMTLAMGQIDEVLATSLRR